MAKFLVFLWGALVIFFSMFRGFQSRECEGVGAHIFEVHVRNTKTNTEFVFEEPAGVFLPKKTLGVLITASTLLLPRIYVDLVYALREEKKIMSQYIEYYAVEVGGVSNEEYKLESKIQDRTPRILMSPNDYAVFTLNKDINPFKYEISFVPKILRSSQCFDMVILGRAECWRLKFMDLSTFETTRKEFEPGKSTTCVDFLNKNYNQTLNFDYKLLYNIFEGADIGRINVTMTGAPIFCDGFLMGVIPYLACANQVTKNQVCCFVMSHLETESGWLKDKVKDLPKHFVKIDVNSPEFKPVRATSNESNIKKLDAEPLVSLKNPIQLLASGNIAGKLNFPRVLKDYDEYPSRGHRNVLQKIHVIYLCILLMILQ